MDEKALLAIVVIAIIAITLHFKGQVDIPVPGQTLLFSEFPKEGTCMGSKVTYLGKPNFAPDPVMQHMVNQPCSQDVQCQKWKPIGYTGEIIDLRCCINQGLCYETETPTQDVMSPPQQTEATEPTCNVAALVTQEQADFVRQVCDYIQGTFTLNSDKLACNDGDAYPGGCYLDDVQNIADKCRAQGLTWSCTSMVSTEVECKC